MPRPAKWGPQRWGRRPVSPWAPDRALLERLRAEATRAREDRFSGQEIAFLVDQIRVAVAPTAGSTSMETHATNTSGGGLFDVLGGVSFHDTDARRDPAGLPDIISVLGPVLFLAEFKARGETPRPMQELWLERLAQVRYVWSGCVQAPDWPAFVDAVHQAYLLGRAERTPLPEPTAGAYTESTPPVPGGREGVLP